MQVNRLRLVFSFLIIAAALPIFTLAQVNTVDFGKNRLQYKKFDWKFYQSPNFNVYFNTGGLELAKFVTQVAEEELPQIQSAVEYSMQRSANIVLYNNYDDYKTSNIGLGIDWQNSGGVTKLVNNKLVIYFDGNKNTLRLNIREGIAKILTDNILFGDDIGEFASNQALLDLPQWLTDGYVEYVAENWSTERDEALRNAILSGEYNNFYQFAFEKPTLAGHSFWYYIAEKYKPENVTYFLYLARLYKNLNSASERICKKKFKEVLADFMIFQQQRYVEDIKQRRNAPRGKLSVIEELKKGEDFYRFAANPNAKNNSYAVVQFRKGVYSVKFVDNLYEPHTILKYGTRTIVGDINPNYPILAWDGKGSRLLVIYSKEGKTFMFVYDVIANIKRFQQEIEGFEQIVDAGFMFDANTLIFSAVKKGQTDIFTYRIDNGKSKQITNDVYDDLDPTPVSFPNRSGIIFASNRPGVETVSSDTVIPSRNHFNIFLVDLLNNSDFKQISQLTKVKYGNARYPTQYNVNHFTYVNDENGVANRWAGFFSTQRDGLDTLYYVGEDIVRNPIDKVLDSTLNAWQKQEPDSVSYLSVYKDSTYTFPITNYQSSLLESRIAGNNGQVSEVRREGDLKFLYKLQVDSVALRKRNVNARPTDYVKSLLRKERVEAGATQVQKEETPENRQNNNNGFQNEFEDDRRDSSGNIVRRQPSLQPASDNVLSKTSLHNYRLKFNADYILAGITNNILVNRYQPYQQRDPSDQSPVQLNNSTNVNFSFRVGVSDLMEDVKFIGGIRFGTSLSDKDVFLSFQNYRKRLDWGLTFYRSNVTNYPYFYNYQNPLSFYDNVVVTSLYQANVAFPLSEINSFRLTAGIRRDNGIIRPIFFTGTPDPAALGIEDSAAHTAVSRLEFVHDNSINPANNIWVGSRWKIYFDYNVPVGGGSSRGRNTFNLGFDARHYERIYRNFIWAVRGAGDMSFGDAKLLYYLGGVDGWFTPKFTPNNLPKNNNYAFQSLTLNMRGFNQNIANGNNAFVINSELRLPVFSTFINKPINAAFLRNFQLVQFIDLGTAWEGSIKNIARPTIVYSIQDDPNNPVTVKQRAGGIGPLAGGYGFGARSTLLGYFLKIDAAWQMNGLFRDKPRWYFAMGFDF
ncbi:hypothetical protein [Panacibacter microcysteis]|uniref:hypothetical protein n=1 Tax=Panacibacter microcysteis TaxID=2793269 RepID=UPI001E3F6B0A|nr:hypothetical protein [Panacibacter microcysteis]